MKQPLLFLGDRASFHLKRETMAKDQDGFGDFELVHANTPESLLLYAPGSFYTLGHGFNAETARVAEQRHRHFSEY